MIKYNSDDYCRACEGAIVDGDCACTLLSPSLSLWVVLSGLTVTRPQ